MRGRPDFRAAFLYGKNRYRKGHHDPFFSFLHPIFTGAELLKLGEMKKQPPYIDAGIRLLFIPLYTYTALMKLLNFPVYRIKMRRQPFPEPLKELFVWGVPTVELLMAVFLIIPYLLASPRLVKYSMAANLALMGSFTVYTALAATGAFGYVPCACGGFLEGMGWWPHVVFNLVFTALAAWGVWLQRYMVKDATVSPSVCGDVST